MRSPEFQKKRLAFGWGPDVAVSELESDTIMSRHEGPVNNSCS